VLVFALLGRKPVLCILGVGFADLFLRRLVLGTASLGSWRPPVMFIAHGLACFRRARGLAVVRLGFKVRSPGAAVHSVLRGLSCVGRSH